MNGYKGFIIKTAVFVTAFIIACIVISILMNRESTEMTVEMGEATYPTVSVLLKGEEVNLMHGYGSEMEPQMLRDTLTPLNEDRSVSVVVHPYENHVLALAYEVRSADASRLVESTEVTDFTETGDGIRAVLRIKDLIETGKEYILAVVVTDENGRKIRYYTRIIQKDNLPAKEMTDFVRDFSSRTFDRTRARSLIPYLESNESGDNSSYAYVNIHSSFDQVTWGSLKMKEPEVSRLSILEMDESTGSFRITYTLSRGKGKTETFYAVEEYYRIRYTPNRIYLLDYDRYMRQVFDPDRKSSFANDKVVLGITDPEVDFLENEDGRVVAFVQNGALYAFRNSDNRAVRIFSFFRKGDEDERNRYDRHGIRILQVDEAGNVRFIVYGYMNRGRHEGQTGVSVYYYNNAQNRIEEEIYIPYTRSFDYLESEIGKLAYSGGGNELYLYLYGSILEVNLSAKTSERLADIESYEALVVSDSGKMAGWQSADGTVYLSDFSTGKLREIRGEPGMEVTPLGFVGDDFIYGLSDSADIIESRLGVTMKPMRTLVIEDSGGTVLKTYEQDGIRITSALIRGSEVNLSRIRMSGNGGYISIEDDQIVSREADTGDKNAVTVVVTEEFEKIVEIDLAGHISFGAVHVVTPEEVLFEGIRELRAANVSKEADLYAVYAEGRLEGIYDRVYEAVNTADGNSGVVLDSSQRYIWQKGNREPKKEVSGIPKGQRGEDSLAVVLNAILQLEGVPADTEQYLNEGQTAMEILNRGLPEAKVLDLGGCSLDSVLYYVGMGSPVIAEVEADTYVLIVGYDEMNTLLMDPSEGTIYKKGLRDSAELFASRGDVFMSYIRS